MTKNEIANQINCTDNISRTIISDEKLNFAIGDLYNNQGKAESWSGSNCSESFSVEKEGIYTYVFFCKNVPCHAVDYENEEECEILNCEGCENEGEVLVPANTKMKVIDISKDDDFEEMGYYSIYLELA